MADSSSNNPADERGDRGAWSHIIRGMWRSPLGLVGVLMTTISATLMALGLIVEMFHLTENVYVPIFAFMVLPGGMVTGLLLIPLAGYLRRRQFYKYGITKEHLQINLSDHAHRKMMIWFTVLTVIFFSLLGVIGYEAYHFADSPYFCGEVCHIVMEPEYVVYQRSAHAKVACVECHIGSGVSWFVKAKISGLRQVVGVITGNYSRPIPAPVEHLRPARDTCESCHWPEKFSGKKIVVKKHFTNDNQLEPEISNIALHIGGHNPESGEFEGIHWHVSKDVKIQYLSTNQRRSISRVKVQRPDGSEDEFIGGSSEGGEEVEGGEAEWRTMDCLDCHNRPTHVYDLPEDKVDFGLLSKAINPEIEGIREDSITVLTAVYNSREEAQSKITTALLKLVTARHGLDFVQTNEADIRKTGEFLVQSYLANIWPDMNIEWGTYGSHLGHQREAEGWGCFRCHDDAHENSAGTTISQNCDICHDEPE